MTGFVTGTVLVTNALLFQHRAIQQKLEIFCLWGQKKKKQQQKVESYRVGWNSVL